MHAQRQPAPDTPGIPQRTDIRGDILQTHTPILPARNARRGYPSGYGRASRHYPRGTPQDDSGTERQIQRLPSDKHIPQGMGYNSR